MARKNIRFNYFEVVLIPIALIVRQEVAENEEINPFDVAIPYNMTTALDAISVGRLIDLAVQVSEEVAEIERETLTIPNGNIRSFQLSKLKETNIPAKKRIGQVKEHIILQDDEYIGEFTSVIYDSQLSVMMIQSNKYGVNIKEIESYLTGLRQKYLELVGNEEENPNVVRLRPIIDDSQATSVLDAQYYRKITVRGATLMEDALNPDGLMGNAARALGRSNGISFEITLSVSRSGRDASLDRDYIAQIVNEFNEIPAEERPKIEISKIDDDDSGIDVVNLLEPKMTDKIQLEIEPRITIAHEFLYNEMLPVYNGRRGRLIQILRPRN